MNLSEIQNRLQQVLQLVEDWHEKGVNELERDLALGILREIYADMRFNATPQPETIDAEEPQSVAAPMVDNAPSVAKENTSEQFEDALPIGVAISLDDVFESFIHDELIPVKEELTSQDSEATAELGDVSMPEPAVEELPVEPESTPVAEVVSEEPEMIEPAPVVEPQPEVEEDKPETEPEPESEPEKEADAAAEIAVETEVAPAVEVEPEVQQPTVNEFAMGQPSLFGDEVITPRKSRRTRMMSLYDDEPEMTVTIFKKQEVAVEQPMQPETPAPVVEEPIVVAVEPEFESEEFVEVDVATAPVVEMPTEPEADTPAMPAVEEPANIEECLPAENETPYIEPQIEIAITKAATSVVPESDQVLGEVIKSDVRTIADTITPKSKTVEQMAKGAISDIGKAVGINDRFLLIRDLFGGSSEMYEQVVARLNSFDNLEDCMIYIVENFDWNPNSDGAKLMMELIERKYS